MNPKEELQDKQKETLAQRIRVVRGYYGKSQAAFAKELEISQSAMSAMEVGKVDPPTIVIQKIGKMGFDLNWLLYGETPNPKKLSETSESNLEKIKINKILGSLSSEELRFCRQWLDLYVHSLNK